MGQHQPGIHREIKEELVFSGHRFHLIYAELAQRPPVFAAPELRLSIDNLQTLCRKCTKPRLIVGDRKLLRKPIGPIWSKT